MKKLTFILLVSFLIYGKNLHSQYLRAVAGTDIPMQYLFGVNYQQGKYISGEVSLGYVGIPYNGQLYQVINVPDNQESRKDFLMETTDDGYVFGLAVNGHYKKWYGGVFTQRLELHSSASYRYLIGTELFQEELNDSQKDFLNLFIDEDINFSGLTDFDLDDLMQLTTVTWQVGLKVGRRFFLKNKRWEFRTEFGWSKNIASQSNSEYNAEPFDESKRYFNLLKSNPEYVEEIEKEYNIDINLDDNLDDLLDFEKREEELDEWFHKYAYIPTLNFRFTYLLFIPKKLREVNENDKNLIPE